MDFLIVTNNKTLLKKYQNTYDIEYKDVSYLEVLKTIRDKVHKGYKILTHPLSGSVKPNETPYKTIIISKNNGDLHMESLSLIENSINMCSQFVNCYPFLTDNIKKDFQMVDLTLVESALESIKLG